MDNLQVFADGLKHHRHSEVIVAARPLTAQRWMPLQISRFLELNDYGLKVHRLLGGLKVLFIIRV
jgi:hypothetical protein